MNFRTASSHKRIVRLLKKQKGQKSASAFVPHADWRGVSMVTAEPHKSPAEPTNAGTFKPDRWDAGNRQEEGEEEKQRMKKDWELEST